MTTKERLHKLVDELSEAEANGAQIVLDTDTRPPEMAPAPEGWDWDKTSWDEPMPNVVAWIDQSRQGR